jgi:hypothetical protein
MQITDLILYLLATTGLTLTISWSKIFSPVRDFTEARSGHRVIAFIHDMISCPFCLAFWMGIVVYYAMGTDIGYMLSMAFACPTIAFAAYKKFFS